ncbi:LicD family protein [Haliovirga abyssi]|uniref:LPS biosynthesis protein n=1 Tax=Haliovirga abyssi TaxID=2996794 RepID=A0AAU9DC27_9FUSO|nr:LicD family protein [Haliovirga abyssi]BDU49688.1 LPS biosynthesis protein [Haliovirga abyssi]
MKIDELFPDERKKYIEMSKLRQIQLIELRIFKIFDYICKKNNIEYWRDWGNLLGAVRHKGFIPWDDDIDIGMTLENYQKMIEIFPKKLPKDIFFQTPKTDKNYDNIEGIKLRDRYSNLNIDDKSPKIHNGIFIEVFPVYKVPSNKILQKLQISLYRNLISCRIEKGNKLKLKVRRGISKFITNFISFEKLDEKILNMYKLTKNYMYRHALHSSSKEVDYYFSKDSIFPLKEIEYEGYKFRSVNDYDEYLKTAFGDYMKLPPENERGERHMKLDEVVIFEACNHIESLNWKDKEKI